MADKSKNQQTKNKDGPCDDVQLARMNGLMMIMPALEFLIGAVDSENGIIYDGNRQKKLGIVESIARVEIIYDGGEKNHRPHIRQIPPKGSGAEDFHIFTEKPRRQGRDDDPKILGKMLRNELGHLEHVDYCFAAENFLQS